MILRAAMALTVLLAAIGCGGGGASISPGIGTSVAIAWSARVAGNTGPAGASSAVISIRPASGANEAQTVTVERAASSAAYTKSYAILAPVPAGPVWIGVQLFSGGGGSGTLVGTGSGAATLASNGALTITGGAAFGAFQTSGTVAAVTTPASMSVAMGSQIQVPFFASDANGNPLTVAPASVHWVGGDSAISCTTTGVVTGLLLGQSPLGVGVSVENFGSGFTAIQVYAPPSSSYIVVNQPISNLVFNSKDGLLYGINDGVYPTWARSIVAINPASGQIVKTVPTGNATTIAISSDGTTLYAGIYAGLNETNSIQTFSLPSLSALSSFSLGSDGTGLFQAITILPVPGLANSIVALLADQFVGGVVTAVIYDSGVARKDAYVPNPQQSFSAVFGSNPNTLYALTQFDWLVACPITSQGFQTPQTITGFVDNGNWAASVGNILYSSTGATYNLNTGKASATLPASSQNLQVVAVNGSGTLAYLQATTPPGATPPPPGGATNTNTIDVVSITTNRILGSLTIPLSSPGQVQSIAAIGSSGLAISYLTNANSSTVCVIVKNTQATLLPAP